MKKTNDVATRAVIISGLSGLVGSVTAVGALLGSGLAMTIIAIATGSISLRAAFEARKHSYRIQNSIQRNASHHARKTPTEVYID